MKDRTICMVKIIIAEIVILFSKSYYWLRMVILHINVGHISAKWSIDGILAVAVNK